MRKAQRVHCNQQLTTTAPTQERAWQPPYFRRRTAIKKIKLGEWTTIREKTIAESVRPGGMGTKPGMMPPKPPKPGMGTTPAQHYVSTFVRPSNFPGVESYRINKKIPKSFEDIQGDVEACLREQEQANKKATKDKNRKPFPDLPARQEDHVINKAVQAMNLLPNEADIEYHEALEKVDKNLSVSEQQTEAIILIHAGHQARMRAHITTLAKSHPETSPVFWDSLMQIIGTPSPSIGTPSIDTVRSRSRNNSPVMSVAERRSVADAKIPRSHYIEDLLKDLTPFLSFRKNTIKKRLRLETRKSALSLMQELNVDGVHAQQIIMEALLEARVQQTFVKGW